MPFPKNQFSKGPPIAPRCRGIVFDLDGTLVDSLTTTFAAFNHAIVHYGGQPKTGAEIMSYFGPGESQIFAKIIGPEHARAAYVMAREYLDRNLAQVPLHRGVGELLERLKTASVPVAIFTGRSWDTTEMILKSHGLLDRFVTVVANDHVKEHKPSPEGLRLALSRMKLEPSDAFMVGDHPADLIAARGAGTPGIAALWDPSARRELLEPHEPKHWAERPETIWEILQE
jgi:HAD superfamily hydrolase (TIGR01549 family)